jgi:predicted methyltransferase
MDPRHAALEELNRALHNCLKAGVGVGVIQLHRMEPVSEWGVAFRDGVEFDTETHGFRLKEDKEAFDV